MSTTTRTYGSWTSAIQPDRIAEGGLRLSQPRWAGRQLYWLEGRPAEAGRQVVMRAGTTGGVEVTPAAVNVRTRVHEYGGGDYLASADRIFFSSFADQRVHCGVDGRFAPLSPAGPRYADYALSPDGRWLAAVEERAREGQEPENRLVAFRLPDDPSALPEPADPVVLAAGHDFYSAPVFSNAGDAIAYTAWDHPQMPWDGTVLYRAAWGSEGPAGDPRAVAGGPQESIVQPAFSPSGVLTCVSDRSGYWNLHQQRGDTIVPLCPMSAEFAGPQWVFGLSSYAFVSDSEILCSYGLGGTQRLGRLDVSEGRIRDLTLPYSGFSGVRVASGHACFIGSAQDRAAEVVDLDLAQGTCRVVARGSSLEFDDGLLSRPEAIEFETAGGRRAHAYLYLPANSAFEAPPGERPPLLVKSHGGPTSAASSALDLRIQYWTSRGFAVVDVDYGGSTGFGRAYRELLRGQWGIVDVEDCVHAAEHLAEAGRVDAERLAISGGSAGGYTTLCALTFHDRFHAGASHYGIGDLEALVADTHKFEARYTDGLVGPYPEDRATYVARSPIHHPELLSCPAIFFQGLEDKIVPPNQSEAMVAALAERGIRHAYVPFEGEQHGFRKAENIARALAGELYFYSQIFGFECDASGEGIHILTYE
jgi:dipeptidyl aminopeptidase/acylaminoacyl peptidase